MEMALTAKAEERIYERLARGQYQSASEVIEDALEALSEREDYHAVSSELDKAQEDLARGDYEDFDADSIQRLADRVKDRGLSRLKQERTT
jgi:Arc/MetJ-type ribon-helix-helix transcriptional regulator